MKLKDQLMLREVAGQYVIIPTGERVREVTSIVYISSSAAYLWDYMKDHEFTGKIWCSASWSTTPALPKNRRCRYRQVSEDACRQQHP